MSAKTKNHLITFGIATVAAALVVWASNNVEVVDDVIG